MNKNTSQTNDPSSSEWEKIEIEPHKVGEEIIYNGSYKIKYILIGSYILRRNKS